MRVGLKQFSERVNRRLRADMSGPKVDDSDIGLTALNRKSSEVSVVRNDHPPLGDREVQEINIRRASQSRFIHVQYVETDSSQECDNVGMDVLIREQFEIAQCHVALAVK